MRNKKTWRKVLADHRKEKFVEATSKVHVEKSDQLNSLLARAAIAKKNNIKAQILKHANPQNRAKGETGFHDDDEHIQDEDADLVIDEEDNNVMLKEYGNSLNFLVDLDADAITKNKVFDAPSIYQKAKFKDANPEDEEEEESDDEDSTERLYEMRRSNQDTNNDEEDEETATKKLLPIRSVDGSKWLKVEDEADEEPTLASTEEDSQETKENEESEDESQMEPPTKKDNKAVLKSKTKDTKDATKTSTKSKGTQKEIAEAIAEAVDEIEDEEEEGSEMEEEETSAETPKSTIERIMEAQEALATLAQSVTSDSIKNVKLLHKLNEITLDKNPQIKKLAILTQLAVYKDIIPGYRIRKLTEAEQSVKVSKDVKDLRNFEQSLLHNYQRYLQTVETIVKKSLRDAKSDKGLAIVGIRALCELLISVPHFNFRLNIMTSVVNRMCIKEPVEVGIECCQTINKLFYEDTTGEFSLEAVRLILKICKLRDFDVPTRVVQTFLSLRLKDELVIPNESDLDKQLDTLKRKSKANQRLTNQHKTRKERKIAKEQKVVEAQIKAAELSYDRDTVRKNQTETLKNVFTVYFRVLKREKQDTKLLSTVLEGLALFAHLINVEFFADLLNILKDISKQLNENYLQGKESDDDCRNSLHCIIAAFQLMNGQQGDYLKLDLSEFYVSMYVQLLKLPMCTYELLGNEIKNNYFGGNLNPGKKRKREPVNVDDVFNQSKSQFELALQGFELLFYRKRQVPLERVASFIKRLTTVMLSLPESALFTYLNLVSTLFVKYPRMMCLIDADEISGGKVFNAFADDPDGSNALAGTKLWELQLLKTHYSPRIQQIAIDILKKPAQGY